MEKREKILLALAGVAMVIGGWVLLTDPGRGLEPPASVVTGASGELRREIAEQLPRLAIGEREREAARALNRPWLVDPFHFRTEKSPVELGGGDFEHLFRYTGYVEMGPRRMAIINDREFGENEALEIAGARLRHIYPDRVLIAVDTRETLVVIPFEEEEGR
ncbi:MAG TPA: hypothetical protein ENN98_01415 [Desulfurivibrio alkaliphilus]|uniref:Uncharacterized protein n=1 Tax=Desulfurivibrio alkaliphilus TaxID=427923 RepID=A0A7C2TIP7_9BACT|nr:hypothetical protein [Desulfurivibrio alkaliphilus]